MSITVKTKAIHLFYLVQPNSVHTLMICRTRIHCNIIITCFFLHTKLYFYKTFQENYAGYISYISTHGASVPLNYGVVDPM